MAGTIPGPADSVESKFNDLLRRVQNLETSRSLEAATISKGGLEIKDGGSFRLRDPDDGTDMVYIGAFTAAFNRPDGKPQMGVELRRDTGEIALSVFDQAPLVGGYQQFVALWDRAQNVIVSDDTNGGQGLARPHLAASGMYSMVLSQWPSTTSATYQNLLYGFIERQQPGITFAFYIHADAATTGQFQLTVDGVAVATSPTVTNAFQVWSGTYYWPAGWTFGSAPAIGVDGIRTAGAGTVAAQTLLLQGAQSP